MFNRIKYIKFLIYIHAIILFLPACGGGISSTATFSSPPGGSGTSSNSSVSTVSYSSLACTKNSFCTVSPVITGSTITSAQATGLPSGLTISSSGVISGTPTAVSSSATYSVILVNSLGGIAAVTINITVYTNSFSDSTNADFSAGTLSNLIYDTTSGYLRLSSGQTSGTFTSKVRDAGQALSWGTFSWVPTLPFYKKLPDNALSESTSTYSSLNSSSLMSGILGLWHMDSSSWNGTAGEVIDSSGQGNNGVSAGGATISTSGKFGNAAYLGSASNYLDLNNGTFSSSISFDHDFSVSYWFNPSVTVANHWLSNWIKTSSSSIACNGQHGFTAASFWDSINSYFVFNVTSCASTSIQVNGSVNSAPAGSWYHVVNTYDGASFASRAESYPTLRLYVNGALVGSPTAFTPSINSLYYVPGSNLGVGYNAWNGAFSSTGYYDEFAVFGRILSASEVLQLYRRGANRLQFQVRTCTTSDCSDNPVWKGYDNTNSTYFSELNNTTTNLFGGAVLASAPSLLFSNFLPTFSLNSNQYFQYRTLFQSDDTNSLCTYGGSAANCSPELQSVSIFH